VCAFYANVPAQCRFWSQAAAWQDERRRRHERWIWGSELKALFLFSGGGLFVHAGVLGERFQVVYDATTVTLILPAIEDAPRELGQISERRGSTKSAHIASWNAQTAEIHTAVVDTFEVRVGEDQVARSPSFSLKTRSTPRSR